MPCSLKDAVIESTAQSTNAADPTTAGRVWVVSDGAAGNERQALALANAMGLTAHVIRLHLRAPWRWFAPRLPLLRAWRSRAPCGAQLQPPWPALAIGCGRQAALLTRALREWSEGTTFALQILDPRIAPAHFDLVVAPRHDTLPGGQRDPDARRVESDRRCVAGASARDFPSLAQLPQPRTALADRRSAPRSGAGRSLARSLIAQLERWRERDGGSLLIPTSRRTPRGLARTSARRVPQRLHLFLGRQRGRRESVCEVSGAGRPHRGDARFGQHAQRSLRDRRAGDHATAAERAGEARRIPCRVARPGLAACHTMWIFPLCSNRRRCARSPRWRARSGTSSKRRDRMSASRAGSDESPARAGRRQFPAPRRRDATRSASRAHQARTRIERAGQGTPEQRRRAPPPVPAPARSSSTPTRPSRCDQRRRCCR